MSPHHHNKNFLAYELDESDLLILFNKVVGNLCMSLDLVSKLPHEVTLLCYYSLPLSNEGSYTSTEFVNFILAHIINIHYSYQVKSLVIPKSPSSEINEDALEEQKEQLLQSIVDSLISGKQL